MKRHKNEHSENKRRLSPGAVWAILTMALVTGLALNYGEGQRCRRIRAEEELAAIRSEMTADPTAVNTATTVDISADAASE